MSVCAGALLWGGYLVDLPRGRALTYSNGQPIGYRLSDLVRLDVRINEEVAPPLATVVHRESGRYRQHPKRGVLRAPGPRPRERGGGCRINQSFTPL